MAKIKGTEGMTGAELSQALEKGGKFVVYRYVISVLIMTFYRSSDIYFFRAGENTFVKGIPFSLITLLLGWWGIPWGPIRTLQSLGINISGGEDMTEKVLASI